MPKIPVHIITGFLGSGKTTFLREILDEQNSTNIAVIVNELGQISLDHTLISSIFSPERTMFLNAGCMCCNKREDLIDKFREILDSYEKCDEYLERVIIETTGLANPAPILFTFLSDTFLLNHFQVANTLACVDALSGISHINENEEAQNQILTSDFILLTKTDLNSNIKALQDCIYEIYQGARFVKKEDFSFDMLLNTQSQNHTFFTKPKISHNTNIRSVCVSFNIALDWASFGIWLSMLLHKYGSQILRIKGLIDIGEKFLVNVNGVGHIINPPTHIYVKDFNGASHIIFIAKNLDIELLILSMQTFLKIPRDVFTIS